MYLFIASKQTARPGSRLCIISSRSCLLSVFFLIQRPRSSCCTTRLLLTTSSFLTSIFRSSFIPIPFDGCIEFIRNVTRVIIDCSEWGTAFTSRGLGLQIGPSERNVCPVAGSRLWCSVFDSGFVNPNKKRFRLLKGDKSVFTWKNFSTVIQK